MSFLSALRRVVATPAPAPTPAARAPAAYRAKRGTQLEHPFSRAISEAVIHAVRTLPARDLPSKYNQRVEDDEMFATAIPRFAGAAPSTENESLHHMDILKRDIHSLAPPAFAAVIATSLPRLRAPELVNLINHSLGVVAHNFTSMDYRAAFDSKLPARHERDVSNFLMLMRNLTITNDDEWDLVGLMLVMALFTAEHTLSKLQDSEEWSVRKTMFYRGLLASYLSTHVVLPLLTQHESLSLHLMRWERLSKRALLWASGTMQIAFDRYFRSVYDSESIAYNLASDSRPLDTLYEWDRVFTDPSLRLATAKQRMEDAYRVVADANAATVAAAAASDVDPQNRELRRQLLEARHTEAAARVASMEAYHIMGDEEVAYSSYAWSLQYAREQEEKEKQAKSNADAKEEETDATEGDRGKRRRLQGRGARPVPPLPPAVKW